MSNKFIKKEEDKNIKRKKVIIGALFIFVFILGWILGRQDAKFSSFGYTPNLSGRGTGTTNVDFSVFWRAWDLLEKNYDGKVDYQKMVYGAIEGMTNALGDPYTAFMTPEDAKLLSDDLSGIITGIGAEIGIRDDKLTVIAPIDDSPAKKAGIMAGDHIIKINDEVTSNMDVNTAVYKIRGEAGTKVNLTIDRKGTEKVYEIVRAKITVKSVKSEIKNKNVGYISINRFDDNTTYDLRSTLSDFTSKDIKKIIIDLRDNPGGYLDESVTVASEFIKEGVIVTEKKDTILGKSNSYKATGNGIATSNDIKIVILINNGSASASEIVAGAIKDYKRGTLVGEKTFGKGSVQEIENLSNGAKMRITIAHWYTPSGKNIGKEGIAPDVEIKMTEDDYNKGKDPQLDKALELLK